MTLREREVRDRRRPIDGDDLGRRHPNCRGMFASPRLNANSSRVPSFHDRGSGIEHDVVVGTLDDDEVGHIGEPSN